MSTGMLKLPDILGQTTVKTANVHNIISDSVTADASIEQVAELIVLPMTLGQIPQVDSML